MKLQGSVPLCNLRNYALRSGSVAFWKWLALFEKLMAGEATDAMRQAFLKVMDKKLIIPEGQGHHEWVEDFLRCFQGSAFKFTTPRPVMDGLENWQRLLLKGFLDGPDLGDVYKLDGIDGRGRVVRGLLVEMDFNFRQFKDWIHTPRGEAVDWTKVPKAVQMKSINSATDWQENNLAGAINKLINWQKTNPSVTELTLSIKKNPSLDTEALETVLLDYIDVLQTAGEIPPAVEILLDVKSFVFMP